MSYHYQETLIHSSEIKLITVLKADTHDAIGSKTVFLGNV